jgi:hypothetical protein
VRTGNRGAARGVLADEIRHHLRAEPILEVDDVVRDADDGRDAAGVVEVVDRAAGAEVRLSLALVVELHGHTDDVMPLLGEQGRGDR